MVRSQGSESPLRVPCAEWDHRQTSPRASQFLAPSCISHVRAGRGGRCVLSGSMLRARESSCIPSLFHIRAFRQSGRGWRRRCLSSGSMKRVQASQSPCSPNICQACFVHVAEGRREVCGEWGHAAGTSKRVLVHPKSLPHSCISPVREGMEVCFEWKHEAGSGKPVLVQPNALPRLLCACRGREEGGAW
jgi:hypothetical protein